MIVPSKKVGEMGTGRPVTAFRRARTGARFWRAGRTGLRPRRRWHCARAAADPDSGQARRL